MVVGSASERPAISAIRFVNRGIVDAGDPPTHQAALVELPKLISIGPEPLTAAVVPLIGEAHRHPVLAEPPKLLNQPVLMFCRPFAGEKRDDLLSALKELGAISPSRIRRVGERDARGIAAVPGVLGDAHLGGRGVLGDEGRQGWTFIFHVSVSLFEGKPRAQIGILDFERREPLAYRHRRLRDLDLAVSRGIVLRAVPIKSPGKPPRIPYSKGIITGRQRPAERH